MKAAISVKSPFSHNALFGFMKAPFLGLAFSDASFSQLQWCIAFAPATMPERRHDLLERLAGADRFPQRPGNFAGRPTNRMDAFSQILSGVQLTGAVFFSAEFSAPWGLTTPTAKAMAATA